MTSLFTSLETDCSTLAVDIWHNAGKYATLSNRGNALHTRQNTCCLSQLNSTAHMQTVLEQVPLVLDAVPSFCTLGPSWVAAWMTQQ
jgi:hypothetical protein